MTDDGRLVDIRESGLLWLINRTALHPRGYALGYDSKDRTFTLLGDGSEPWRFVSKGENPERPQHGVDEDALFAKIKDLMP